MGVRDSCVKEGRKKKENFDLVWTENENQKSHFLT